VTSLVVFLDANPVIYLIEQWKSSHEPLAGRRYRRREDYADCRKASLSGKSTALKRSWTRSVPPEKLQN
jgi:hypothetical protein